MKVIYKQRLLMQKIDAPQFSEMQDITCSKDSYCAAMQFWEIDQLDIVEHFYALYLNRANKIIAYAQIAQGAITGVTVDTRIVFAHALLCAASSVIVFHNHPSGNLKPSQADISLTQKLKTAGQSLDINIQDHIIISPNFDYYSFCDNGMMH